VYRASCRGRLAVQGGRGPRQRAPSSSWLMRNDSKLACRSFSSPPEWGASCQPTGWPTARARAAAVPAPDPLSGDTEPVRGDLVRNEKIVGVPSCACNVIRVYNLASGYRDFIRDRDECTHTRHHRAPSWTRSHIRPSALPKLQTRSTAHATRDHGQMLLGCINRHTATCPRGHYHPAD
jgi:hypothetical protein